MSFKMKGWNGWSPLKQTEKTEKKKKEKEKKIDTETERYLDYLLQMKPHEYQKRLQKSKWT